MAKIDDVIDAAQTVADQSIPVDEKVRILMQENARLRKKITKEEAGWELLDGIVSEVYDAPTGIRVISPKKSRKKQIEVAVLHLSDLHFGKRTKDFNIAVAEERMIKLGQAVFDIVNIRKKWAAIDKVIVLWGGDFLENESGIFPTQPHLVDIDLLDQMIKIGPEIVTNTMLQVGGVFNKVEVRAVPGNHGRLSHFNSQRSNADSVFYEVARKMLAMTDKSFAGRIEWDLPLDRDPGSEWFSRFPIIGDHGGMLIHGHEVRGALGFPWYGVGKKVQGWNTSKATRGFNNFWMGHFHTAAAFKLNDVYVMASGTIESSNEYALQNMASGGSPNQRLTFFNERYGMLADHLISLD